MPLSRKLTSAFGVIDFAMIAIAWTLGEPCRHA